MPVESKIEVGAKTQINLNNFYFTKMHRTYGQLTMLLAMQLIIYGVLKIAEVVYFGWSKNLKVVPDSKILHSRQRNYHIVRDVLDLCIIVEYWLLNYHRIMWKQTEGVYIKKGIDLRWRGSTCAGCLGHYYNAYFSAISKTVITLILRPYTFLNPYFQYFQN